MVPEGWRHQIREQEAFAFAIVDHQDGMAMGGFIAAFTHGRVAFFFLCFSSHLF